MRVRYWLVDVNAKHEMSDGRREEERESVGDEVDVFWLVVRELIVVFEGEFYLIADE